MNPLSRLYWFVSRQLGLDPVTLARSLRALPQFVRDMRLFRKTYNGRILLRPCLKDSYQEGGTTRSEYFWQDLIVARWVYAASPRRHLDVGSRVDGFVAHIASFREIDVLDIRPIRSEVPGITFIQGSISDAQGINPKAALADDGYDSVSCLHVIEHLGLGRYGDPIDPHAPENGLRNLAGLLAPGGTLYLSTPIGIERVEFNANRIFCVRKLLALASLSGLDPIRMLTYDQASGIAEVALQSLDDTAHPLSDKEYSLAIVEFRKRSHQNLSPLAAPAAPHALIA